MKKILVIFLLPQLSFAELVLSCELQSAPGGGIELEQHNIPKLQKGQAVIFKPGDRHRATPPTEGERISFTIWAMAKNANKVDRS